MTQQVYGHDGNDEAVLFAKLMYYYFTHDGNEWMTWRKPLNTY